MKIGILSDTHSKVDKARQSIEFLSQNGAEFLIHAGDVCNIEVLDILKSSNLGYVVVYGNNDAGLLSYQGNYNLVREPNYFKLSGIKFKLMHLPFYMSADADVVIYGHTHTFSCEFKQHTLFLNPGEVCAREKPMVEFVMLDVLEKSFRVDYYADYKLAETFNFQR